MSVPPAGRTGILIVRAWLEGRPPALRVRVTGSRDVTASGSENVACAATVGEATAILRQWLQDFEAGDDAVTQR